MTRLLFVVRIWREAPTFFMEDGGVVCFWMWIGINDGNIEN